jgi:ferredoxin
LLLHNREEWEVSLQQKGAMAKMQAFRAAFEERVLESRRAGFEQVLKRAEEDARIQHKQNKIDRAMRRQQVSTVAVCMTQGACVLCNVCV